MAYIILGIAAVLIILTLVWLASKRPYVYLGVVPVNDDDPIMLQAVARGKATIPLLRQLFVERRGDATVKFGVSTDSGALEFVWAKLLDIEGDRFSVFVQTVPLTHSGRFDRERTISTNEIGDWQVEMVDGKI